MRFTISIYKCSLLLLFLAYGNFSQAQKIISSQSVTVATEKAIRKNFVEVRENNQALPPVIRVVLTLDHLIWIVTEDEGLISYNSSSFTHFSSGTGLYSLPSNRVTNLFEEDNYTLWISTRNAVCKYDRIKKQFIPYYYNKQSLEGFGILKLRDGRLICSTNLGLCFINNITKTLELLPNQRIKNKDGKFYEGETIQSAGHLLYDENGSLWSNIITQNLQGLANFNLKKNEWTLYPQENLYRENFKKPDRPENITTWFIHAGMDGNRIWVGGYGTGLRCFEKNTGMWYQYYFKDGLTDPDWENTILTIYQKNEDELLVGTYMGLKNFNIKTKKLYKYASANEKDNIDLNAAVHCITKDNCGNLWIGGQMGLIRIHDLNNRFATDNKISDSALNLQAVMLYDDKTIVLADYKKPNLENHLMLLQEGRIKKVKNLGPKKLSPASPIVKLDRIGAEIISFAGDGIMISDTNFSYLKPLPITLVGQDGQLSKNYTPEYYSVVKWDDSIFYACRRTTAELGFIKINIRSQKAWQFKPAAISDTRHPVSGSIRWLYKDNYNRLWCCTDDHGLSIFYPLTANFENYQSISGDALSLSGNIVRCVLQSSDGYFWISTNAGLCRAVATPGKKARFELIVPGIESNFLIEDTHGNIWVNYKNGNIRVNIKTLAVHFFTQADGYIWSGYFSKKYLLNNGQFLMPDGQIIDLADIPKNNFQPSSFITGVSINNKPLLTDSAFPFKKNIVLNHSENFISIDYSCDNYVNEQKNAYEYKLSGIDTGWIKAGSRTSAYYTNLAAGTFQFAVRAANNDGIKGRQMHLLTFNILPAWYQTWWFKTLAILVALTIIYLFYNQRINQLKANALAQKSEAALKQLKTEFEKQIAETEMIALRAQMNPHFIFNVLNSINKYILENDSTKASYYLTQFSRLIRQVLENSKSSKVTLEADLQALQLYINMEKLRFEERFTCNIEIDKNIDQQFIQVPPLLIQPYAENAIWHGLMQKETPGHLDITVFQPSESSLRIIIKDNGIGRKKAMSLQSKSATKHKSYGMQITKDRIDIVNKIFMIQATVEYEDLYENGEPAGTSVTLIIPV